jgi:hypothetical protein
VARSDPILVICDRPSTASPNDRAAWYEFRPEPDVPSVLCLAGGYSEVGNPAVDYLPDLREGAGGRSANGIAQPTNIIPPMA